MEILTPIGKVTLKLMAIKVPIQSMLEHGTIKNMVNVLNANYVSSPNCINEEKHMNR